MENEDKLALAAIIGSTSAVTSLGAITVATITTTAPAWGPLGWIGLTTVTASVVALPVASIVAVAGAAVWGGYKVYKVMSQDDA